MTSSSERMPAPPLTREAAEALAAPLAAELIARWGRGERPLVEELLARHPELWEHPAAAADLIYEELCLRQEYGAEVPVEEVLLRFPQWQPQLEVLFDCQRLLGPRPAAPQFPSAGESLGDFLLLAELGGGAHGRVFLASQRSLGDRPVVLKLTAEEALPLGEAPEHLALARLQHTHIVPVYSVQDYPARGLRALCMPYFGGATLAQLLEALRSKPPAQRTGQDLLNALDRIQAARVIVPARQALAGTSYVQAVCWIGACLADALQYAHERGLIHLDLKPSNVLLTADGQPMVLDFHLARGPLQPEAGSPALLGGTAGYMSPEQEAALQALQRGEKVPGPVDGRSDIYSLGVVLYEALGGTLPGVAPSPQPLSPEGRGETEKPLSPEGRGETEKLLAPQARGVGVRGLHDVNAQVSVGLADMVGKCLARDPGGRYPDMAALATDLRRHLASQPLLGVRNRLGERWRKWRRRRPHGVALAGMMLAVLTAAGAVAVGATSQVTQRLQQAHTALSNGQIQTASGEWEGAISTLQDGLVVARGLPFQRDLADELERQLHRAEQGRAAAQRAAALHRLHQLADRARFLYEAEHLPPAGFQGLETSCRSFWASRGRIVARLHPDGAATLDPTARDDLLDLAICWADLQVRLAPAAAKEEARQKALTILAEAEALFGPNPVLAAQRQAYTAPPGRPGAAGPAPSTAWEHYALGRALLRAGDLKRAAEEVQSAVRLQPQSLWPNFYLGVCAYRLDRYVDAVAAFSVCIGAAPEAAGCFYNRGLALDALGRTEQALHDYDQALRLEPTLAAAALNRGMLHYRAKDFAGALTDLERARELGAEPAVVAYNLALVHLARGEQAAALDQVRQALRHDPQQPDARKLYERLQGPN